MTRNSGTILMALVISLACRREAPPVPAAAPAAAAPGAAEPKPMVDEAPAASAPAPEKEPGSVAPSALAGADRSASRASGAGTPERAKRKTAVRAAVEQQRPLAKQRGGRPQALKSAAAKSSKVVAASEEVAAAAAAPASPAPTARATLRFKNEAGDTFKLVEARFVMDGAELPTVLTSGERGQPQQVFSGELTPGRHLIASRLTYQGADRKVFTYMKGYTFRVRSDDFFEARGDQTVAMTIVCKEKTGFNQPVEKRLVVTVE